VTTVISDSTCLIAFERIERLDILPRLFTTVFIPPAVDSEFGQQFDWLHVAQLDSSTLSDLLKMTLGKGEAEAIALSIQLGAQLITDDKQARSIAEQLGIEVKGALGTLVEAKRAGILDSISPIIVELETNGFRISKALREEVLRIANE
jgi:predicted nucleic acid-binding protein